MFATLTRVRVLAAVLALAAAAAPAAAAPAPSSLGTRTTEVAHAEVADAPPAGSPELGVLLIIGVVAVLIFMAWLLSRVGDDSPQSDGTII